MKKIVSLSKSFLYLLIFTLCFSFASANLSYAAANDDASKTAATNADKTAKNKEVAGTCTKEAMDSMYNAKDAQNCWYCRIVTLMTDAFLQAAESSIPTTQSLGKVILKWGFLIWLGIFLLQQLSSMGGISTGKMLQEIFMMGFKCAFAYYALEMGTDFITNYILNPIVSTGTGIGKSILTEMLAQNGAASG